MAERLPDRTHLGGGADQGQLRGRPASRTTYDRGGGGALQGQQVLPPGHGVAGEQQPDQETQEEAGRLRRWLLAAVANREAGEGLRATGPALARATHHKPVGPEPPPSAPIQERLLRLALGQPLPHQPAGLHGLADRAGATGFR